MQKNGFLFTILILYFLPVIGQERASKSTKSHVDKTKSFKKEIPRGDIFYNLAKAKQKQLGLVNLENGFDSLQIRIWYDYALIKERKLLVIKNENAGWTAKVYKLKVLWNGRTETIVSKELNPVTPNSGWSEFSKKMLDLKILSLPDMVQLVGYSLYDDGRTYNVEVATKNLYRFYGYCEPQENRDKFWQAKNMAEILDLLETELNLEG